MGCLQAEGLLPEAPACDELQSLYDRTLGTPTQVRPDGKLLILCLDSMPLGQVLDILPEAGSTSPEKAN